MTWTLVSMLLCLADVPCRTVDFRGLTYRSFEFVTAEQCHRAATQEALQAAASHRRQLRAAIAECRPDGDGAPIRLRRERAA